MEITFDPVRDAIDIAKHGSSLGDFRGFDEQPVTIIDDRFDYGEQRFQARGRIAGKPFCLVYTETADGIRVISFRRAHAKEMRRHE